MSAERRTLAFSAVAGTFGLLLFGAGAPSPLYLVYQQHFGFSSTTLTAIFAVYAVALLATLIPAGSLSDHSGRRPLIFVALAMQGVSAAIFLLADGTGALYAARVVQGIATGTATGALGAALIDLQPGEGTAGALTASVAPPLGLAAGVLTAGALVQLAPSPLRTVYWVEVGLLVAAVAALVLVVPETVRVRSQPWRAITVRVRIPPAARGPFAAVAPGLIATWALGGLYFSLGPGLVVTVLHTESHVVGALMPATLSIASAVASIGSRKWDGRRAVVLGALMLAAGVAVTLVGIRGDSWVALFLGSLIAGIGFGPAFAGTLRTLAPLAPAQTRAELLAAIYLVSYLAFSVPVVIAGLAVSRWGLRDSASGYAIAVIALALAAAAATSRARRSTD